MCHICTKSFKSARPLDQILFAKHRGCACAQGANGPFWGPLKAPQKRFRAGQACACIQSCSIILSISAEKAANEAQPMHMPFGPALCASTAPAAQPAYTLL